MKSASIFVHFSEHGQYGHVRAVHGRFFFSLDPLTDPLTDGVGEPGDLAPLLLAAAMAAADAASALGQLDSSSKFGGAIDAPPDGALRTAALAGCCGIRNTGGAWRAAQALGTGAAAGTGNGGGGDAASALPPTTDA